MSFRSSCPEVLCKKDVLKNFTKFTGKHLCRSLLRPAALFKKRHRHRCFPVNFTKFLRTSFFIERLWWLLLEVSMKGRSLNVISVWVLKKLYYLKKLLEKPEKRLRLNSFSVNQQVSAKSKITSKDTLNRTPFFFKETCEKLILRQNIDPERINKWKHKRNLVLTIC